MLHYFCEVKYKNKNVLVEAYNLTINSLLNDQEVRLFSVKYRRSPGLFFFNPPVLLKVPVKVEAAIALQMMLSHHEDVAR